MAFIDEIKEESSEELAQRLIVLRAEKQTIEEQEDQVKKELLSRNDFEKYEYDGIKVSIQSRKNISLLPEIDLEKIKERYPELVGVKQVLNTKQISENVLEYIKEKYPEAITEEVEIDKNMLHKCTKDYTTQTITRFMKIEGIGKAVSE